MTSIVQKFTADIQWLGKIALMGTIVLILSACSSSDSLWQGGEAIHKQANAEYNKVEIDMTKDQQREMRDRLNTLEGLYIDLMREVKSQNLKVAEMTLELKKNTQQNLDAGKLNQLSADVRNLETQLRNAVGRIAKTEMFLGKSSNSQQISNTPKKVGDGSEYAAHIGSYRSEGELMNAFATIKSQYSTEINGLKALKTVETVPGLGNFIYLLVGPFSTQTEANSLCETLKSKGLPKCSVSSYKGTEIS